MAFSSQTVISKVAYKTALLTCQMPIFCTLCPKGRWWYRHSLKASVRISITLFSSAHRAARGNAEEKSIT